jgi:hypothetical protein
VEDANTVKDTPYCIVTPLLQLLLLLLLPLLLLLLLLLLQL